MCMAVLNVIYTTMNIYTEHIHTHVVGYVISLLAKYQTSITVACFTIHVFVFSIVYCLLIDYWNQQQHIW